MLKEIQKEVENLRIKVYSGLSTEDTDTALYEIEQMLFKAMDKQLTLTDVSQQRELLTGFVRFERLQDYKYKLLPLSEKIKKYQASLQWLTDRYKVSTPITKV